MLENNQLTNVFNKLTMSSVEMAELTNTRHDSVKRTIKSLLNKGILSHTQIVDGIKSSNGIVEQNYKSDKLDSLIIVARLSPKFMAAVVTRWQELEAKQSTNTIPLELHNKIVKAIEDNRDAQVEACLQSINDRFVRYDVESRARWCLENAQMFSKVKKKPQPKIKLEDYHYNTEEARTYNTRLLNKLNQLDEEIYRKVFIMNHKAGLIGLE